MDTCKVLPSETFCKSSRLISRHSHCQARAVRSHGLVGLRELFLLKAENVNIYRFLGLYRSLEEAEACALEASWMSLGRDRTLEACRLEGRGKDTCEEAALENTYMEDSSQGEDSTSVEGALRIRDLLVRGEAVPAFFSHFYSFHFISIPIYLPVFLVLCLADGSGDGALICDSFFSCRVSVVVLWNVSFF